MKRLYVIVGALLLTACSGSISSASSSEQSIASSSSLPSYSAKDFYIYDELHNGDAKFYKNKIITSVGSQKLAILNEDTSLLKSFEDTDVSWLDGYEEENILVYGNFQNQIGIVRLDDSFNMVANEVIMKSENVQIDPTINKYGDTYYITATEIVGNINNGDPNTENGEYILHLYSSTDLKKWNLVSDIVDCKNNIEDVDFDIFGNVFYAIYEKEEVDKGNSSIQLKKSTDFGKTWSIEKELLESSCDHEPAKFLEAGNGFCLFYSCDKDDKGKSYMGGKTYCAFYDKDANLIQKDFLIPTSTKMGILLYDIKYSQDDLYLLYAKDYLTTRDLVVESLETIK